jgi:M6 family metalloprotease-like protein
MRSWQRLSLGLVVFLLFTWTLSGSETDLDGYRTPEQAITTKVVRSEVTPLNTQAYLGVHVETDANGWLVVQEVAANSPAAKAGVRTGDQLILAGGVNPKDAAALSDLLRRRSPGEALPLLLARQGKRVEAAATLTALSRPVIQGKQQAVLGIEIVKANLADGSVAMAIESIAPDSPAERAALRVGEIILKVENVALTTPEKLRELVAAKKPGDTLTLTVAAPKNPVEKTVVLGGELVVESRSFDTRKGGMRAWTKGVYRLGIILVEYPDEKHNATITPKAWEDSMFSKGTYNKASVTGQTVYGSMFDHYFEQSYGKLKIEGKAFDHVQVKKKRGEYATGNRSALLTEAMDLILARDGKDAFKDLDGVFFVYAGTRYNSPRGSLYWPHRASVQHKGKSWPYFICQEQAQGKTMANISVFSHEFGHMVGLPDLYARPENPGMEGVGVWCLMANQVGNGRPQHMCAWSKERLGWVQPAVIDPTVKQKLVLPPIADSPKNCFKVLLHRDGSEYLLLENRTAKGFDKSLPATGLLIWRVVGRSNPVLEESHGVAGPQGPNVYRDLVPYPSAANDAFTPYTVPSSQSKLGGGLPVHITNIRRLPDGRITFHIGYVYQ